MGELAVANESIELFKITLPDGMVLVTHRQDDEHWQKVLKHWVEKHSDEYELVPIGSKGTGKKHPTCSFTSIDMGEGEYRSLDPYPSHPTCRIL